MASTGLDIPTMLYAYEESVQIERTHGISKMGGPTRRPEPQEEKQKSPGRATRPLALPREAESSRDAANALMTEADAANYRGTQINIYV